MSFTITVTAATATSIPTTSETLGATASNAIVTLADVAHDDFHLVDFSGAPSDVLGSLTYLANVYLARSFVEGMRIKLVGWVIGNGGFYKHDPLTALPIDIHRESLISKRYPVLTDYAEFTRVEFPTRTSMSVMIKLDPEEVLIAVGEIGIIAQIVDSPEDSSEDGTLFLFSVVHMPVQAKTQHHAHLYRVVHELGSGA